MIPVLFLAHGSPMTAVEDNEYTRFLENYGKQVQPKAIVIFTAHWESSVLTISSFNEEYETIYDFSGFPKELYMIQYPAKGSTEIAFMLEERFAIHGIETRKNTVRGLDHGAWTLLYRMFPKANIPVVQLSVNPYLSPKEQVEIGKALQGLGEQDILVIGSGVTVHNLRMINWTQDIPESWAVGFDDWLLEKIDQEDIGSLLNYESLAPNARYAVPSKEHFVPLLITIGAGNLASAKVIHRSYQLGTLSYLSLSF